MSEPQQVQPVTALAQLVAEVAAMSRDQAVASRQQLAALQQQTERQTQLLEAMLVRAGATLPGPSLSGMTLHRMTGNDDAQSYLETFEATAAACGWPEAEWAVRLPLLSGDSQTAALGLPASSRGRYQAVKKAVLDRLGYSAEDHRRKLRGTKLGPSDRPFTYALPRSRRDVQRSDGEGEPAVPSQEAPPVPVFDSMEDFPLEQSRDDTLRFAFDQVIQIDGHMVRPDAALTAVAPITANRGPIGMDLIGPFHRSARGYRFVLVLVDYATRYPEALPLRTISAKSVAQALFQVISRVGIPKEILTDQGTQFMSRTLRELYGLLGIKSIRTSIYHPQTDGLVERLNKTLKSMILREVPQASTGFSPFELLFGRKPRGVLDLVKESWEEGPSPSKNEVQYILDLRAKLHTLGRTSLIQHHVETHPGVTVRSRPYRLPEHKRKVIQAELEAMLKMGVIEESHSAWCSPIVLVVKKDGSIRFCVDYRKVNDVSQFDAYPMPRVDELLDRLGTARFFTTLDLTKGYWQIPLSSESKEKTAFSTPYGLYQFVTLPFGLFGAPATFQRLMDRVLRPHSAYAAAYLDDVIIHSNTWAEHVQQVAAVLESLRQAGLTANPKKCAVGRREVRYLGYHLGGGQVRPQGAPDPVQWTEQCQVSLERTDASGRGLGAVLSQQVRGVDRPVLYISRKLSEREARYSTVERECLAIRWAVGALRYYLLGRPFTLCSDHAPLQWLHRMKDANARITRWYLALQPFKFTVVHRPGAQMAVADFLSRSLGEAGGGVG
ncbi:Retrovirus-related Pol polyprotein from transposon 412 [Collichthys lucidus]|uniref:ribonuclease H n=1 Tax=Collichthys lucidus TaxID=240159 RepID=A0A4V6ALN6_COLLU|nr:Retrovirus-related Pol polyprotein from transposon 412 [Collichthys lucidus]